MSVSNDVSLTQEELEALLGKDNVPIKKTIAPKEPAIMVEEKQEPKEEETAGSEVDAKGVESLRIARKLFDKALSVEERVVVVQAYNEEIYRMMFELQDVEKAKIIKGMLTRVQYIIPDRGERLYDTLIRACMGKHEVAKVIVILQKDFLFSLYYVERKALKDGAIMNTGYVNTSIGAGPSGTFDGIKVLSVLLSLRQHL